jgi:hypothetical protein
VRGRGAAARRVPAARAAPLHRTPAGRRDHVDVLARRHDRAAEHRGAAFGWLGLGLQICTAASPLASGAIAAASIPGAFVFDGALARVAAALLLFGARGLRRRPAA